MRSETERRCDPGHDLSRTDPSPFCEIGHRDRRATSLREAVTVGVDHQRYVQVGRLRIAEEMLQVDLPRGGRQQIVASYHLGDTLGSVIDDDGEVVRRDPVVSSQYDVVDPPGEPAVDHVVDGNLAPIGAQSHCRAPSLTEPIRALDGGEISARARIRTRGAVRSLRRRLDLVANLAAGAIALVDETAGREIVDRSVVASEAFALADDGTVPVDPDGAKIVELRLLDPDVRLVPIEVFHTHDEVVTARSRRQPGNGCCPQVAEVEVTGRGGSKSTGHADSVADRRGDGCTISYSHGMRCPRCGIEVSEHQKFCHECGADLSVEAPAARAVAATEPLAVTEPVDVTEPIDLAEPLAVTEPVDLAEPIDVTEPVEVAEPVAVTEPIEVAEPVEVTEPMGMLAPPTTDEVFAPPVTAEMPAVFDGHDDLSDYPAPREPFQIRIVFLLAIFGAAAMLMAIVADVIDLRTTRPTPGIATGPQSLDDLGSNLAVAGFIGTALMVIGGLLTCFGLRWGAGLAGGAGLAVAGWAGLSIGLAEFPIAVAESITRTSSVQFTLRVTRDLGFWLIVGIGVIGLIVFLASLRSIGSGGRPALNPLVAAITAVAMVVLAFGPLVPVNDAVFADNFRSVDPNRDLPAAFFAGRLGQVGLIALAGVVGMLIVRSYGLGLAAGGASVPLWLWLTSLGEIGSNPVGIAYLNPGADNTVPHAVTTVGMVATLALLVVAAALATHRLTRSR